MSLGLYRDLTSNVYAGFSYVQAVDQTPPIITVNPQSVTTTLGSPYADTGVTATDNNDGDITGSIVTTGSVDVNTLGSYTLSYSVTDAAGNVGTASRVVTVIEQTNNVDLTEGVRVQLRSRTNNLPLTNGSGFEVHIIEKGVSISDLTTDSQGYLIVQDVLLDTLGEEVGIAVSTVDGEMTGYMRATVEDLTTYLT